MLFRLGSCSNKTEQARLLPLSEKSPDRTLLDRKVLESSGDTGLIHIVSLCPPVSQLFSFLALLHQMTFPHCHSPWPTMEWVFPVWKCPQINRLLCWNPQQALHGGDWHPYNLAWKVFSSLFILVEMTRQQNDWAQENFAIHSSGARISHKEFMTMMRNKLMFCIFNRVELKYSL